MIAAGALLIAASAAILAFEARYMARYKPCSRACPRCRNIMRDARGVYICALTGKPVIRSIGSPGCPCREELRR